METYRCSSNLVQFSIQLPHIEVNQLILDILCCKPSFVNRSTRDMKPIRLLVYCSKTPPNTILFQIIYLPSLSKIFTYFHCRCPDLARHDWQVAVGHSTDCHAVLEARIVGHPGIHSTAAQGTWPARMQALQIQPCCKRMVGPSHFSRPEIC